MVVRGLLSHGADKDAKDHVGAAHLVLDGKCCYVVCMDILAS